MQGLEPKRFSRTLFLALALISGLEISAASQAMTLRPFYSAIQDEACFLVTASGQRVSLGQLCGETPASRATAQPARKPASSMIRAKIKRRIASTPVIEVVFNGDRRFDMIVDTGASGSLITQRMANALQIRPTRTIQAGIADGSIVEFPVGQVRSMSVGGLRVNNIEVAISSQMEVGLLGHDFFGNYDIKIKRDTIEFYPRESSQN